MLARGAIRRARRAAALCALTLGALPRGPQPSAAAPRLAQHASELRRLVDSLRVALRVPALAAVVVRSESVDAAAVGLRRSDRPDTVTDEDRFHLGSNGKAITATLIARVVERGLLSWASTPAELFPEDSASFDPQLRRATLRQLLGHASGLASFDELEDVIKLRVTGDTPSERRASFARAVLRRAPAYAPGAKHVYSNAGYAVAGAMLERATGRPFERLLDSLVAEPLGIALGIGWPAAGDARQPWGHGRRLLRRAPHDPHDAYRLPAELAPAGDMNASMGDYGRFLQAHLRGLRGRDGVLPARAIELLHTPVPPDGPTRYALGWGVQDVDGVESHVHVGSAGTFVVVVILQPSRDFGVAVAANAGDDAATAAVKRAALALLALGPRR